MKRLGRWMGALGVTLGLGCHGTHGAAGGAASEDATPPSATEDGAVPETSAADGAAGDAMQMDAGSTSHEAGFVDAAEPPARGCGVVRRLALPGFEPVRRVPGGFVLGPKSQLTDTDTQVRWLVVSEDGQRRVEHTRTATSAIELALLPLGSDPFAGVGLRLAVSNRGSGDHVEAELLASDGTRTLHDLGPAFYRGTIAHAGVASFEGNRAVYVTGHVGVDNPHAFVVDERGERVGAVVPLMQQTSPSFDCLQVVPTQMGGAIGVVDKSARPPELRVFGLSEQAQVRDSATFVFNGSGCPFLQAASDGIFVNVAESASTFDLRILRGSEQTQVARQLPWAEAELRLVWVHEREPGDLLFLFRVEGGNQRMARLKNEVWTPVDAELPPLGEVVRAEPGRLFVMSPWSPDDAAELYEIACGELGS